MLSHEQQIEINFVEDVLDIIDNRDEFSRGDLQGAVEALYQKYFNQK